MSEKPISPLRRRMIEDMTVRNFVEKTHNDYIRLVRTGRVERAACRSALPRKRVRCVLGMLSSLEVKVFCPT